jgi:hypothetical protein
MASTPEAKVKKQIKDLLKSYGAYYAMPVAGMFGKAGVPDFLVCHVGYFIGIEAKAGKGKTTALQEKNLEDIRRAGGLAIVVNESNLAKLDEMLKRVFNSSPNSR